MDPDGTKPDARLLALRYDALTRQLERMRGMQAAYFGRFFWWVILTLGAMMYLQTQVEFWSMALLPFLVITAGVQASFYLYYVDFARLHARALEEKINRLLGEETLIASRLEDVYFYPLDAAKFSGFSFARPLGFFSGYTLHWCGVWGLFFLSGVYYTLWFISNEVATQFDVKAAFMYVMYFCALAIWMTLNLGYLAWYYRRRREEKAMGKVLAKYLEEDGKAPEADLPPSAPPTGGSSS